ncbi:hypothetical protein IW139_002632 [Coemansia sp. RSA 353]|nr:hypothetical protein GGH15_002473 [Coemansia sp. RSA 562]KAJ2187476.1 hypothetical protein EV181_002737 [Coemansia sp. RSA 532]KAJ2297803.1 hypothetical protein IW139_002632 [Coemansia sp. RSA 353]
MTNGGPPIEPNLTRANLCGTCQQRLRRAVDAAREPQGNDNLTTTADFRRHRSIRATIQESNARAAQYSAGAVGTPISAAAATPGGQTVVSPGQETNRNINVDDSIAANSTPNHQPQQGLSVSSPLSANTQQLHWRRSLDTLLAESSRHSEPIQSTSNTPANPHQASSIR